MAGYSSVCVVGFGLSGDEDHVRESLAEILSYEIHDAAGAAVPSGVSDLRLGTTDHNVNCLSCARGKKLCPGHRGHLVLRAGVPQPIGTAEIRRWLRVACLRCGAIIVEREKYERAAPAVRLVAAAAAATEGRRCPRRECGAIHPKIVKDDEDYFTYRVKAPTTDTTRTRRKTATNDDKGEKLPADAIKTIFSRISDADCLALGRSLDVHPRKLILRVVPIAPNTIRPGVKNYGGANNSYNDSTSLLQNLVKRNGLLPRQLPDSLGPNSLPDTSKPRPLKEAKEDAPEPGRGRGNRTPDEEAADESVDRAVMNMQQIYYDLVMGSSSTSATQGNSGRRGLVVGSRPVRSFLRNLPRKDGRIRANLLGKRVFYISRSTISGNMSFRIDEVGLPLEFARTLQVEETVQEFNKDFLMPFFLNGHRQYPGCTQVRRRATGELHDVTGRSDFTLEVGDVMFRDVIDGDIAYFNRQPSLERSNIGCHRVIVIQDPSVRTIQMNVLACEGYGADFDGDQMNLWIARGPAARAEALIQSSISNWFISTKTGSPLNGQVQDSIIGADALTRSATRIDKYHAMALFASAGIEAPRFDRYPDDHLFTGRDIISFALERTPIDFRRAPTSYSDVYAPFIAYDPDETLTVIEQGRLVRGVLDKESVGAKAGGIFHLISREYGSQRALDALFTMQQIVLQFLMMRGFTVGPADLLPSDEALVQIRALVSSVLLESRIITDRLLRGEIVPPIDSTVHDFFERMQVESALKIPETEVMRWILGSIRPDSNGFFRMIATGAKGSNPNLIQVNAVIGQTTIDGQRITERFAFRRTMPYYPRFATDPAAYGFVANGYMVGMRTDEFICQDMNGRFDLINKALTTATTGYFMRKGVMNNQSSVVSNNRFVLKDTRVVQFIYGENACDPREQEKVSFRTVTLSNPKLREMVWIDVAAAVPNGAASSPAEIVSAQRAVDQALEKITEDRDTYRKIFMNIEAANFGSVFTIDQSMPVNVRRVVDGVFIAAKVAATRAAAIEEKNSNDRPNSILGPSAPLTAMGLQTRIERVWDLCRRLPYTLLNEIQERLRRKVPEHMQAAASLLCMLVRAELNPAILARLSDEQLTYIIDAVRQRYSRSLIEYGTAAGTLAAQAISQPLTQYMLDSHHRSVGGGTNKSGLIRISEIYGARDVSEEIAASMLLPLRPEALGPPEGALAAAQTIANSIEFVTLRRFVRSHDVLLEPYSSLIYPLFVKDRTWITEFEHSHPLIRAPGDLTNLCIRFVLDKSALVLKAVELELIIARLRRNLQDRIHIVHTPEAVPEIVIRIWQRASQFKKNGLDAVGRLEELVEEALETPVRGIPGVRGATAEKISRQSIGPDGALVSADCYAILCQGTNLYKASLNNAVDATSSVSSSVGDTYKLLGIEAARMKIISETKSFMEGRAPAAPHIYIYSDEMTRTGRVTSIERNGLGAREHSNILLRMAYGAPIQTATDAVFSGARSKIYGISAPQMLGSVPAIGTFYNTLVTNEAFIKANTVSVSSALDNL